MMASKTITLAVQSQEGQKRVQIPGSAKTDELYNNVKKVFELNSLQFALYKKQNKTQEIISSRTKTVKTEALNHGDRLFMFPKSQNLFQTSSDSSSATSSNNSAVPSSSVVEDDIDQELAKMDGKIPKKGKPANSIDSLPYDPFDEEYLKENNIKFMSFHSYIKKLSAGMSKGKFTPLRNTSHVHHVSSSEKFLKYSSLPSAVTLSRQSWRHVDTVMFENSHIVDRFLQFWR